MDSAFIQFPDCIILFMGDFNADPGFNMDPPNEQGRILLRYLDRWSYVSVHLSLGHGSVHTYESEAHKSFYH